MRLVRVKHLLITVATMLSLAFSAVYACACSHHGPVSNKAENSCHGQSHDASVVEKSNDTGHVGSDCDCFIRSLVPAFAAKKDDNRTSVENQIAEIVDASSALTIGSQSADARAAEFRSPHSNYQKALLESLPSRAPPRL
ncbi:MAG TPA: hypothetical protein VFZ49_03685 [Pyrinomonadaceae bacterium]